jgi:tetratricopeptide (TPR) repeat protein
MQEPRLIAGRYRVVRPLGRGGNARVFEVIDEMTEARLALKLLLAEEGARQHVRDLFQREFNTLAQLAHPLIVRVFDYGLDETPYYTMELIVGQSLRERLPWAEACSLLRDVASALSLVHSRRLVHRDVTHRNVYRTEDGHAKLFDFGALCPIGPASEVVGTPPFIPPEAVAEQRLDARSDLFSLGALGYFLLTQRHAFPARSLGDLGEVWRRPVELPSRYTPDIPAPLDELVISLLSLDPYARPASAAEVFNRLTAIAELPATEAPEVAQAYLTSPALVGRVEATRQFKHLLGRARQGKGASLVLDGARGLGRSRLLSSFLLEAKLDGFVVLRADAGSAEHEPFALARKLVRQLVAVEPVLARDAAGPNAELLGPILFEKPSGAEARLGEDDRSGRVVDALSAMLVDASRAKPIIVGVDDFERVDAQSKQFIIRLAKASKKSNLALAVALVKEAATDAHVLLRDLSSAVTLQALAPAETHQLICSLFGDVAHVDVVSRWVHGLSDGRPWTALEAATHLVDSGVARFEEGSWVLPGSLEELELPASIDQAQDAKIAMLGPYARRLCQALALSAEEDPLFFSDYGALMDGISGPRLDAAVNELVARSVLVPASSGFAFAHEGIRAAAARSISHDDRPDIHRRIARAYGTSSTPSLILAAFHSLEAGDVETAFTHAVASLRARTTISVRGSAFLRRIEGTRAYERLFEWAIALRKPWADVLPLGLMLLQQSAVADLTLVRHREPIMARLRLDSGLSDWEELSDMEDPVGRVRTAVGRAFARHDATPEAERGLPPLAAIEGLCGAAAGLTGAFSRRTEPGEIPGILRVIEPFRPISPAVAAVANMIATSLDALLGRTVREARLRAAEVLSSPVTGLDEVSRIGLHWLNLYYQALDDACRGVPNAAALATPLLQTATYVPLVWEARMIEALFRGDTEGAEAARKERDLSKLTNSPEVHRQLEGGLLYEAAAFDHLGDLLRLKRCLPWFEERTKTCPALNAYHCLHLGNYHRLRGERAKALAAYERAHSFAPVGSERGEWPYIAIRLAEALLDAGRGADAHALMKAAVPRAIEHRTAGYMRVRVEMMLAVTEAAVGLRDEALARADRAMAEAREDGFGGILLVSVCALEARVAELCRDQSLLERSIGRLEKLATHEKHRTFAAKHAHLLRNAQNRGAFQVAPNPHMSLGGTESTHTSLVAGVRTQIELCRGRGERARRALGILLETAASDEGFLYLCTAGGVELAASHANADPPPSLEAVLAERIRSVVAEEDTTGDSRNMRSLRPAAESGPFDLVEVITESGGRPQLIALAALKPRKGALQPVPLPLRAALSDALITAGDTAGIPWA